MPQPFANLHHISIVTDDIEAMEKFYTSIGVGPFIQYPPLQEYARLDAPDEEGFYQLTIRCARIGPIQLQLIQPGEGDSLYKRHLEKHGPGVFHLGFAVDDPGPGPDRGQGPGPEGNQLRGPGQRQRVRLS